MKVLLKVIKNIFCIDKFSETCNKCSLCHLIDLNNLPSLRIIIPSGAFIKKEQVLELRSLFSKESQYTKESIYIIQNAEKMNKESANTILKFLEEPEGNVIGFFLTNNIDGILPTIQSRCQLLEINFNNSIYDEYEIDEDTYRNYINIIKEYLNKIEVEKTGLVLYNKEYLSDLEKNDLKVIMQIILSIYKSELDSRFIKKDLENYEFLHKLSIKNLKAKIDLIIEILKEFNYNVNLDLLLDRFVIEMDGLNNEII